MNLVDVYEIPGAMLMLYALLGEREPNQSISHKTMPSLDKHETFFNSQPYAEWYLIEVDGDYVGSIYLTDRREIGIHIYRKFMGHGYGPQAVAVLINKSPGQFLANINPKNVRSTEMFESLGFKHIQNTYELVIE